MEILAGTSGFSYPEWKGSFYPEGHPDDEMLDFYAAQLPAVEINNTFYRLPRARVLEGWASRVPASFRFAIKASRRITHMKRLKNAGDETAYLLETLGALGERLGVVLFQLPPFLHKDLARLEGFLDLLPAGSRAAFEFRHGSWFDEAVYAALRSRNAAVCISDEEEIPSPGVVSTADWGYLRLRGPDYPDAELRTWREAIETAGWDTAFVFFKHEEAGAAPRLARRFLDGGA